MNLSIELKVGLKELMVLVLLLLSLRDPTIGKLIESLAIQILSSY
ncbi:hypothetical protein MHK_005730 [Candidatus Magnetomorum sp. HK-1]|nr:hypothetical protein MHK_005730 [Candidatus Magnetomorum sp. HK-1]